jgi:hypothetical protein
MTVKNSHLFFKFFVDLNADFQCYVILIIYIILFLIKKIQTSICIWFAHSNDLENILQKRMK